MTTASRTPPTTQAEDRRILALAATPGAVLGITMILSSSWLYDGQRRFTLFDDAMISLGYARSAASGAGLVWFAGAERVEGITNPLWTFVMALVHRLGLSGSAAALVMMLIGLVCVVGTAVISGRIVQQISPGGRWGPGVATAFVGLCYPLLFWSTRGMEVGLIALLMTGAVSAALEVRQRMLDVEPVRSAMVWLCALLALGLATRVDFGIIAIVIIGWLAIVAPPGHRRSVLVGPIVTLAATLAIMTWARWAYYGELLPNTYLLKVSGISLIDRVERGIITALKLLPVGAIAVVAALHVRRRRPNAWPGTTLLLALAGATVTYSVYAGGDAWEFMPNRYVVPALVATTIVVATALDAWIADRRPRIAAAVLGVVGLSAAGLAVSRILFDGPLTFIGHVDGRWGAAGVLLMAVAGGLLLLASRAGSGPGPWLAVAGSALALSTATSFVGVATWVTQGAYALAADQTQTELGLALRAETPPRTRIAVSYAGAPIYYSERSGIDLLGKSDARVANEPPRIDFYPGHNKWDYQYSITELSPDVVSQLYREPEFAASGLRPGYTQVCFVGSNSVVPLWIKRSEASLLTPPRFMTCDQMPTRP